MFQGKLKFQWNIQNGGNIMSKNTATLIGTTY